MYTVCAYHPQTPLFDWPQPPWIRWCAPAFRLPTFPKPAGRKTPRPFFESVSVAGAATLQPPAPPASSLQPPSLLSPLPPGFRRRVFPLSFLFSFLSSFPTHHMYLLYGTVYVHPKTRYSTYVHMKMSTVGQPTVRYTRYIQNTAGWLMKRERRVMLPSVGCGVVHIVGLLCAQSAAVALAPFRGP